MLKEVSTSDLSLSSILKEATNDSNEVRFTGLVCILWSKDSFVKMYKASSTVRDPIAARALLCTQPWLLLILSTSHAWVTTDKITVQQTERTPTVDSKDK